MSDFHPETWVPAWSVASILNGVLSFMLESTPTVGSVDASEAERKRLALASHAWNRKSPLFCELFPNLVVAHEEGDSEGEAAQMDQVPPASQLPRTFVLGATALAVIGIAFVALQV